ncbi:tetratricopeptide repeat protein [Sorangium sp. So ce1151]|uniref:tetratricopeptide repeat protein n=1 Tax=Sorangium sp. So ce1151 TaxID=3133332 RepID=UPI003F5FC3A2
MPASPRYLLHATAPKIADPTDADFAAAARSALSKKDFRLAIEQASAAVALRPQHEPHLRLLDEVIGSVRMPLDLVALPTEGAFYGLCAARARVLARLNRVAEALDALLQAAAFQPSAPLLPWACAWVKPSKSARRVAPKALAAGMLALTDAARGRAPDPGVTANLEAALGIAERIQAQHPPDISLLVARSRALRALGRDAEALTRLDAEGDPSSWAVAVERAAIHGERGDLPARIAWLERARAARPAEVSTNLDLGDTHLDDGELGLAIAAYTRALELDASSRWAAVSLAYARALASGAPDGAELLDREHDQEAARDRALSLEADATAYTTRLSDPVDPLVGVIRSVRARADATAPSIKLRFRVRAERALAPSAYVAFVHALAQCGRDGSLLVEHEQGAPSAGRLWQPNAAGAAPAVHRPPDEVLAHVNELARTPFEWAAWCDRAVTLSAPLDPELVAMFVDAMAYPPEPPSPDVDAVRWVHGFQIAAAVLAALGPGAVEARKERLCSLLTGVDDWSAGAALLGLRALARARPELTPAIVEQARSLLRGERALLPPHARALAVLGCELTSGEARRDFLRLRARIRGELAASAQRDG